jgi:tRNA-splicing ligase RtcB (3'-phosphate/5'-hydroxy nucleic acid ligase)
VLFRSGTEDFDDYLQALAFAQRYAWENRLLMLLAAYNAVDEFLDFSMPFVSKFGNDVSSPGDVHCHHNYMVEETHNGEKLFVTRKGATRAGFGELGIIPGSMGARTYIVSGLGSEDSFCSCSHGAGRTMSRTQAKKHFTVEEHAAATIGVECDKTAETLDETPGAYKPIEDVILAQSDLVVPVFHMKQFLCVKGKSEGRKWDKKKKKEGEANASVEV